MWLKKLYSTIHQKLDQLDFTKLYHGFKKYDFILYTSKEYCFCNEIYVHDAEFYGNTAIEWNGKIVAIWNVETDFIEDLDVFAANLVHEMYHCYQLEQEEKRFPKDLLLLSIPLEEKLCQLRYQDSRLLVEGYFNPSIDILRRICFIRNEMLKISSSIEEELKSETIEGAAEYMGVLALKQWSSSKYKKRMEKYCSILNSVDIQLNPRRRSYYSGCLFLHLLKELSFSFPLFSEVTIYASLPQTIRPKSFTYQRNDKLIDLILEQEQNLQKMIEKPYDFVSFPSRIVGYDPMNMIYYKTYFISKGFIRLDNGLETKTIQKPVILKLGVSFDLVLGYSFIK